MFSRSRLFILSRLAFFVAVFLISVTAACANSAEKAPAATQTKTIKAPFKLLKMGFIPDLLIKHGIFDPSIEYSGNGGRGTVGYMSFSGANAPAINTLIAQTADRGRSWQYIAAPNLSSPCRADDGRQGLCRYETSALVKAPGPGQNSVNSWHLYVEKYPAIGNKKEGALHGDGVVEVRYALTPRGPWTKAYCMFGPKNKACQVDLNKLHPDLKDTKFYNEMGVLYHDSVLYMSLDASPTASGLGEWGKRKIILIASKDNGASWSYLGTLTDYKDADSLGYFVLTASSLVKIENQIYFLVSPSGGKGLFRKNRAHDGTYFVPFRDINRAQLARDKKGNLIMQSYVRTFDQGHGMADYDELNTAGGLVQGRRNHPRVLKTGGKIFELWQAK